MIQQWGTLREFYVNSEVKLRYFQSTPDDSVRGTMVILPGRASFIEKYEAIIRFWIKNNYQVFVLDWRGHGFSTRDYPGSRVHIEDYSSYATDLEAWLEQVVFLHAQNAVTLYAVSMGALIAGLFLQKDGKRRIDRCLMIVPMFGFFPRMLPAWILKTFVHFLCTIGLGKLPVPLSHYDSIDPTAVEKTPYGLTFSWLKASFEAQNRFSSPLDLKKIQVPLFIALAQADTEIDNSRASQLCRRIPVCTMKVYENASHGIHHKTGSIRNLLLQDCLQFVQTRSDKDPSPQPFEYPQH